MQAYQAYLRGVVWPGGVPRDSGAAGGFEAWSSERMRKAAEVSEKGAELAAAELGGEGRPVTTWWHAASDAKREAVPEAEELSVHPALASDRAEGARSPASRESEVAALEERGVVCSECFAVSGGAFCDAAAAGVASSGWHLIAAGLDEVNSRSTGTMTLEGESDALLGEEKNEDRNKVGLDQDSGGCCELTASKNQDKDEACACQITLPEEEQEENKEVEELLLLLQHKEQALNQQKEKRDEAEEEEEQAMLLLLLAGDDDRKEGRGGHTGVSGGVSAPLPAMRHGGTGLVGAASPAPLLLSRSERIQLADNGLRGKHRGGGAYGSLAV
jgi:hypothetical protein